MKKLREPTVQLKLTFWKNSETSNLNSWDSFFILKKYKKYASIQKLEVQFL